MQSVSGYGIRVHGMPENTSRSLDERMHCNIDALEEILEFLRIKDRHMNKLHHLEKYNAEIKEKWTKFVCMEKPISKDVILKSAHQVK